MSKSGKSRASSLLRVLFLVILFILFLWKVDLQSFFVHFNSQLLQSVLFIQPLVLMALFLAGIRFQFLLGKPAPNLHNAFKAVLLAYGLNCVIPGRISELAKVSYLRERAKVSLSVGVAAVFLERSMDIIFLGVLTFIGIFFLFPGVSRTFLVVPALLMGFLFSLTCMESFWRWISELIPWRWLQNGVQDILQNSAARLRGQDFLVAVFLGIATWILSFSTVVLFMYLNNSIPFNLLGSLAVFIAITLGVTVPALPGGFGMYEAAAVFALGRLGYSFENALAMAVSLHFGQVLASVVGSLIILSKEKIGVSSLFKQISEKYDRD